MARKKTPKRRARKKARRRARRRKPLLARAVSGVRRGMGRLAGLLGLGRKRRRKPRRRRTTAATVRTNPWHWYGLALNPPRRRRPKRRTNPRRYRRYATRRRNPLTLRGRTGVANWAKTWGERAIGFGLGWVAVQFLHEKALSRLLPAQWRTHWAGVLVSKGVSAGISTWLFGQVSKGRDISTAFLWGAVGNVALDAIGRALQAAHVRVPGLPVFTEGVPAGVPAPAPSAEEVKVQLPPSAKPGEPVQALPAPAAQVSAMLNAIRHPSAKTTIYKSPYIGM